MRILNGDFERFARSCGSEGVKRVSVESLGRHLREQREAKGITLEQISRVSNISVSYLRALEEEHYHTLPAPTFAIGFLRQYALCIGLDPEDVVLRYRLAAQKEGGLSRERSVEKSGRRRRGSIWILGISEAGSIGFDRYSSPSTCKPSNLLQPLIGLSS